jgi:hypothetical protein
METRAERVSEKVAARDTIRGRFGNGENGVGAPAPLA